MMTLKKIELTSIQLPEFGLPQQQPVISKQEYENRIELARAWARQAGLDFLLVYGDREHFANLAYLTEHDPRFEEALLVLNSAGGKPILILGNEGMGYAELVPIEIERKLYQGFGLLGQKRHTSPRLEPVLRECGLNQGQRIGLVGWKYVTPLESDDPEHWLDLPAYIVDLLRQLVGESNLVNATGVFVNPGDGFRAVNQRRPVSRF
ncbi:MAG: hypothetical protein U0401_25605 [Anaerolineae bacterium]